GPAAHGPEPPRALGRERLPGRPQRADDPALGPDPLRRRCLRRADLDPRLPARLLAPGSAPDHGRRCGPDLRPGAVRNLPGTDGGTPRGRDRSGPGPRRHRRVTAATRPPTCGRTRDLQGPDGGPDASCPADPAPFVSCWNSRATSRRNQTNAATEPNMSTAIAIQVHASHALTAHLPRRRHRRPALPAAAPAPAACRTAAR